MELIINPYMNILIGIIIIIIVGTVYLIYLYLYILYLYFHIIYVMYNAHTLVCDLKAICG